MDGSLLGVACLRSSKNFWGTAVGLLDNLDRSLDSVGALIRNGFQQRLALASQRLVGDVFWRETNERHSYGYVQNLRGQSRASNQD